MCMMCWPDEATHTHLGAWQTSSMIMIRIEFDFIVRCTLTDTSNFSDSRVADKQESE